MMVNTEDLLTPTEVAAMLGCSDVSVGRWAKQGKLRIAFQKETIILFARQDVEAFRAGGGLDHVRRRMEATLERLEANPNLMAYKAGLALGEWMQSRRQDKKKSPSGSK